MTFPAVKAYLTTLAYLRRHAFDLAKALWLPTALFLALQLYSVAPVFDAFAAIISLGTNPDPAEAARHLGDLAKWGGVLTLGSMIAGPMMTVASLRHIVRGEEQSGFFYLGYGGDELRILAAYILLTAMVALIAIVGGLAVTIFVLIFALAGPAARSLAQHAGDLGLNLVSLWFRLRLSVLFPASLATRTIGLGVSWEATKGAALPLILFWAMIGLTLAPVVLASSAPFVGELRPLVEAVIAAGQDEAAARAAVIPLLQRLSAIFSPGNPGFVWLAPLLYLSTMMTTAVVNVAGGTAWRFLTDDAAPGAGMRRMAA